MGGTEVEWEVRKLLRYTGMLLADDEKNICEGLKGKEVG